MSDRAPVSGNPLPDAVAAFLQRHRVQGRVTVALSGGVDSMVLLDLVAKAYQQSALSAESSPNTAPTLELDALHVHHGLSPNAGAWVAFCERECAARNVPLQVVRVGVNRDDTGGQGIEGAARAARYAAFAEFGGPSVFAAQHADDQAETVLHQLLRGTGLAGLAAMGESRVLSAAQTLYRPLLNVSRADIEAYAAANRVAHVADESNADTTYTRNFLRQEVMPLLYTRFPHADHSLARAARHAAEAATLNEALAKIDLRWDGTEAFADALDQNDATRQSNALYWWLKWHGVESASREQIEEWARQLFRASPTDKPHQAGGHGIVIRRRHGRLLLERVTRSP